MQEPFKLKLGFFLLLFFSSAMGIEAQENTETEKYNVISIGHDNDFFLLTDRYYSSGIFLSYYRKLNKGFFQNLEEQIELNIGQEVYTPNNTQTVQIDEIDRRYAGYSRLNLGWSTTSRNHFLELKSQLGIAGKASGAGGFQRWYHNAIVRSPPPTWFAEIPDNWHVNLYLSHAFEQPLLPNPFGVIAALKTDVAIGSKDVFAQPNLIFYFGRRSPMHRSIAYNRIHTLNREIFFSMGFGYRLVGKNSLLEESIVFENELSTEIDKTVLHLQFDFQHRAGVNNYKVGYRFNSRETAVVTDHHYLSLSYGLSF